MCALHNLGSLGFCLAQIEDMAEIAGKPSDGADLLDDRKLMTNRIAGWRIHYPRFLKISNKTVITERDCVGSFNSFQSNCRINSHNKGTFL